MRRFLSVLLLGLSSFGLRCAVSQKLAWQSDAQTKTPRKIVRRESRMLTRAPEEPAGP